MAIIFGTGHPAVEYNGRVVELKYGEAKIRWRDEHEDITPLTGETVRFYDGSRPTIDLELLNILEDATGNKLIILMQILNSARSANEAVIVYPYYSGGIEPRGFECLPPTAFDIASLGKVALDQSVKISLVGKHRYAGVVPYSDTLALEPWELWDGTLSLWDGSGLEFLL